MIFIAPPHSNQVVIKCPHLPYERRMTLKGNNVVHLQPNCELFSDSFTLTAASHIYEKSPTITYRVLEPNELLVPSFSSELTMTDMYNHLSNLPQNDPITIDEWSQQAESNSFPVLTMGALIITSLVLILSSVIGLWFYYM